MGNNHNQYFGKQKRKILVLGLQNSGKTTLVNCLVTREMNSKIQPTKDLNIKDIKINNLTVTFFDVAGGQRQRVFWKHNYEGTQGVIYLIDSTSSEQKIQKSLNQLDRVLSAQQLLFVPFAIGLSKSQMISNSKKDSLNHLVDKRTAKYSQKIGVFRTSLQEFSSMESMATWLVSNTKHL